jgi:hypothetical protein
MSGYFTNKRITALFFTIIFSLTNLVPVQVWALTNGPAQPEMASFQPAGVSDMVDLFSGDFKYNIPLMDVDGYPLNLAYGSGVGMDDEASWVGLGWNLNVGSINRQLRGMPDDFNGDPVTNEFYQKPKTTIGGSVFIKPEFKGKLGNLSGSVNVGVFNDNYTGIGATVGANAGLTIGLANGGGNTAGLGLNAGLGIQSSTQTGVDVTPSLSLSLNNRNTNATTASMGLSASLGYNTRSGLKDLTLGTSFSVKGQDEKGKWATSLDLGGSSYSFNTEPFYPKNQVAYTTQSGSFTPSFGAAAFLGFLGAGGTGFVNHREVKNKVEENPAFGFLYAERGKSRKDALMDFTREKDNPIIPELPNLAVPVHTPDLFSFASQAGAGQFRLYRGGTGILFDNLAEDINTSQTLGLDVGGGAYFHGGVSYYKQNSKSATQKWSQNNLYAEKGDFQENTGRQPGEDPVYFKNVGEKTASNGEVDNMILQEQPLAIAINGKTANSSFQSAGGVQGISNVIKKNSKAEKRTVISFLTAAEAARGGALEKQVRIFDFLAPDFNPQTATPFLKFHIRAFRHSSNPILAPIWDNQFYRKGHHISEFKVTDDGGKRMVYGLPVYNIKQQEYTFAAGINPNVDAAKNLVSFTPGTSPESVDTRNKGVDWYYSKQTQPAYVTSHLLTGILSPDYVDLTGNGISDDDRGTAVKFNYSKLPYNLKWRTPVTKEQNQASYNKGLLADPEDEKGTIVYGEKEQWYVHSIESKTKIAYFYLADRDDALGVSDWKGGIDLNNKQKRLEKIVLYSKADLSKPIKSVFFDYTYQLCPGVVNQKDNQGSTMSAGKLTLKAVYFSYGNSTKSLVHKYIFNYAQHFNPQLNAAYAALSTDRWGTYKKSDANQWNNLFNLTNDQFPYTYQDQTIADQNAAQWLLDEVSLPTGGKIKVTYESDDYAYVQDKRAMAMVKADGLYRDQAQTTSKLFEAKFIRFNIPGAPASGTKAWFIKNYLNGSEYLFGKLHVRIANKSGVPLSASNDFVACYVKVKDVLPSNGSSVLVEMELISDGGVTVNGFSIAAWQKMRTEYPKYAYPGYENRPTQADPMANFKATINAILNAFKNLGELKESFNSRAKKNDFAASFDLSKSFFRLTVQNGKKLGGGTRVKRVAISDEWSNMVANSSTDGKTAVYGMEYGYTAQETVNGQPVSISSGVASYEPSIGGEENALRQPAPYLQKIKGALNNMFYLEQPFGESFYPAPSVGYSKVTVRNIDASGVADPENETGWTTSAFYTAREFPTLAMATPMRKSENGPTNRTNLFGGFQIHELTLSQGYAVYLNDMHGKPRGEKTYDKSGSLLTSAEYLYFSKQVGEGAWQLENKVQVINRKGEVQERHIGRDIEMYADMRESEYTNYGESINIGVDVIPAFGFPAPIPHWPSKNNDEYRLCRSASVVKVVQSYGIVQKVIKTQNGSVVEAENLAFDPLTGEVLVTRTHNEFKQSIYSTTIPAYWMHPQMGGAYETAGMYIRDFACTIAGEVASPYAAVLQSGDELLSTSGEVYWVIKNAAVTNGTEGPVATRLINKFGQIVYYNGPVKVIRSGRRNLLSAPSATVVSLENPFRSGKLALVENGDLAQFKIIDAKATVYEEDWAGDVPPCATCPDGYQMSADGQWCEKIPVQATDQCYTLCPGDMLSDNYGVYGTDFLNYFGGLAGHRDSYFWGGSCNNYSIASAGAKAPADSRKVPPRATRQDSLKHNNFRQDLQKGDDLTIASTTATGPGGCNLSNAPRGTNWCGRLLNAGVWFCSSASGGRAPIGKWIGLETYVTASSSKTYYLGYGADNGIRVYVNDVLVSSLTNFSETNNFRKWYVRPVTLYAGKNALRIEMYNAGSSATAGVEVYDNTLQQLLDEYGINTIFSTNDLLSQSRVYTYVVNADNSISPSYTCSGGGKPSIFNGVTCDRIPIGNRVNPYVAGYKGNWRAYQSKVYQTNRSYGNGTQVAQGGINARKDGHYANFYPFWYFNPFNTTWSTNTSMWTTANTMSLYDRYGQELETKDALLRYNAALFGFRGNVATGVASNARHREIFYEGFEDLSFRNATRASYSDSCNGASFDSYVNSLVSQASHSGRYALNLSTPVALSLNVHSRDHKSEPYLAVNSSGEFTYKQLTGLYHNGFEPFPGKSYLVSVWVSDANKESKSTPLSISAGGALSLQWKATVEGWKLYEGVFYASGTTMQLSISGSSGVLIDDLRIIPTDAQIKTYAYDARTYRLMAELDENNFATFYEYDEEGILNRVKKETEKGIMTLKETRSTYKRD